MQWIQLPIRFIFGRERMHTLFANNLIVEKFQVFNIVNIIMEQIICFDFRF